MRPVCSWRLVPILATVVALTLQTTVSATTPPPPDVSAESAIVVDAASGEILFERAADTRRPMASLTKLFTAFLAIERAPLDRLMTVSADDLVGEASMGLSPGEQLPFEALLYGMLLPSGNDAASAVARNLGEDTAAGDDPLEAFLDSANARAAELGLSDTQLLNPHGLDQDDHFSTARDIATLTAIALQREPAFGAAIGATSWQGNGHVLYQTNDLHESYPGLIGGKTGVTDYAGYCLMEVAERDGRRVIVVLLGSTSDAWYADAEQLLDYGFATLATPGRLPSFDRLSVPTEAPSSGVVAGSMTTATPHSNAQSLAPGAVVVQSPDVIARAKHSPWLWLVSIVVAVPAALYICGQLLQFVTLVTLGAPRQRPARVGRRARPSYGAATTWQTQPLQLFETAAGHVSYGRPAGSDLGESSPWFPPATREPGRSTRSFPVLPAIAPSFGGD